MPAKKSRLTLQDVDQFLEQLSTLTKEEDQLAHFASIADKYVSQLFQRFSQICLSELS